MRALPASWIVSAGVSLLGLGFAGTAAWSNLTNQIAANRTRVEADEARMDRVQLHLEQNIDRVDAELRDLIARTARLETTCALKRPTLLTEMEK